jgi:hypothetical protein
VGNGSVLLHCEISEFAFLAKATSEATQVAEFSRDAFPMDTMILRKCVGTVVTYSQSEF